MIGPSSNYALKCLIGIGICIFMTVSCRKKDQKYEGIYIGTEHHTKHDSSGTNYSLDTSYYQEFHIEYSKKYYHISKLDDPNGGLTSVHRDNIENHEYYPFGEIWEDTAGNIYGGSAYLKFVGDSMYFYSSSSVNWDYDNYAFGGKRN